MRRIYKNLQATVNFWKIEYVSPQGTRKISVQRDVKARATDHDVDH